MINFTGWTHSITTQLLYFMKTSDLQEVKPIYIHEAPYLKDDEISLVDLVMVLVRRKVLIASIFIICLALGTAKALITQKIYTYRTSVEIGSQITGGSVIPFESPQALLAKLQYSYIPQTLKEFKQSLPDDKTKYFVKSSVPAGSNITLIEIKGTENQGNILKRLLQQISLKAIQDHSRIFQAVKKSLETRLNQATAHLRSIKNNDTETMITQNAIESLSSQLANLRNTREVLPPIKSIEPTGSSLKTTLIISTFAGLFIGIFTAFFTEFLSKVKQKLATNKA